mmetsp:Transcript_2275/g.5918  ORF Transcript_2275/g.5918 Transcript_2275/m.5918 type:complete len:234 (-) Transcript_2275:1864-2565(-)
MNLSSSLEPSARVSFAIRATKCTNELKLSSSKSSLESLRNVKDAIGGRSAPWRHSSRSLPSPRQLVMILSYASWSKRHNAFSPATFTPYLAAAARICRSKPSGPQRLKNGCSMSRISVHVKFSRAPCLPQILTIGSYPSRSGTLSPLRVLKYPAVSSAACERELYHQCTPAHLMAMVGHSTHSSSNTDRAHRNMRSPCSTSSPEYQERKNWPYSLSQLPCCARKKPVSCGRLL